MWITSNEAVEMFARYYKARFRARAGTLARQRAAELEASGDMEGERVWTAVSQKIDEDRGSRAIQLDGHGRFS